MLAAGLANEHAGAVERAAAERDADLKRVAAAGTRRPPGEGVIRARKRVARTLRERDSADALLRRRGRAVAAARGGSGTGRRLARWQARRDWRARIVARYDRRLAALRACDPAFELTHCEVP